MTSTQTTKERPDIGTIVLQGLARDFGPVGHAFELFKWIVMFALLLWQPKVGAIITLLLLPLSLLTEYLWRVVGHEHMRMLGVKGQPIRDGLQPLVWHAWLALLVVMLLFR